MRPRRRSTQVAVCAPQACDIFCENAWGTMYSHHRCDSLAPPSWRAPVRCSASRPPPLAAQSVFGLLLRASLLMPYVNTT